MKRLKIAYFGSPQFSAEFLERMILDKELPVEIKLVVTQPDKPMGRKQILTPTPVKQIAKKYSLEVYDQSIKKIGNQLNLINLALIYFYGQIIPKKILSLPKHGFWNIHFSLLPKLRGPSPVVFSLILGDKKTAISLVQTDEKLDHGDLVAQKEVDIYPYETKIELEKRLNDLSYDIVTTQIKNLLNNKIMLTPQDHSQATYTRFPTKQDGYIEISNFKFQISNSPEKLFNLFRGLYPWPGIWTLLPNGKRLKITDMKIERNGQDRFLQIKHVQLEGKKEVDFETFNKAYKIF
jgi:methionyl-tRNA formyltransferase